jgi:hypothetical protein
MMDIVSKMKQIVNIYSDKKAIHTTLGLVKNALVVDYNELKPLFHLNEKAKKTKLDCVHRKKKFQLFNFAIKK